MCLYGSSSSRVGDSSWCGTPCPPLFDRAELNIQPMPIAHAARVVALVLRTCLLGVYYRTSVRHSIRVAVVLPGGQAQQPPACVLHSLARRLYCMSLIAATHLLAAGCTLLRTVSLRVVCCPRLLWLGVWASDACVCNRGLLSCVYPASHVFPHPGCTVTLPPPLSSDVLMSRCAAACKRPAQCCFCTSSVLLAAEQQPPIDNACVLGQLPEPAQIKTWHAFVDQRPRSRLMEGHRCRQACPEAGRMYCM